MCVCVCNLRYLQATLLKQGNDKTWCDDKRKILYYTYIYVCVCVCVLFEIPTRNLAETRKRQICNETYSLLQNPA